MGRSSYMELHTVANYLTLSRFILAPFVAWFLSTGQEKGKILGFSLYLICAFTDYLDGFYAKHFKGVSELGKKIDPIADKFLVLCVLAPLITTKGLQGVHQIPVVLIVLREFGVFFLRQFASQAQAPFLKVTSMARLKTALQMTGLTLLICPFPDLSYITYPFGLTLLWGGAALGAITGLQYLWGFLSHK